MGSLSRRGFLAGLGSTAAVSTLTACRCVSKKSKNAAAIATGSALQHLNVFFHGLMSLEIVQSNPPAGIVLTFPDIGAHKYKAGSLDLNETDGSDLLTDLTPSFNYTLSGVGIGGAPISIDLPNANFIPQQSPLTVTKTGLRTFTLPRPKTFVSLRGRCRSDNATFLVNAPSGDPNGSLTMLSTVHLLTYDLLPGGPMIKDQTGSVLSWTPQETVVGSGYANLHIFAEPSAGVNGHNAVAAFNSLMQILTLNDGSDLSSVYGFRGFDDTITMRDCSNDGTFPGVLNFMDLRNLPELKPQAGGEVANCVRAIIQQP